MPYSAQIRRTNPSAFLFLIDQSGSMAEPLAGSEPPEPKANFVAKALNRWLQNMVVLCSKDVVRDYFHIGVIGYGAKVGSALAGALAGRTMVPISEIADATLRVDTVAKKVPDGAGGLVEQFIKFPVWVDPLSDDGTPMCQALRMAHEWLAEWVDGHRGCYPPTVVHITDGAANDEGNPLELGKAISDIASDDGNVMLMNCHVSAHSASGALMFLSTHRELPPDPYARMLFDMSSVMPPRILDAAQKIQPVAPDARVYAYNADAVAFLQWLEVGTSTGIDTPTIPAP